jgi:hypothetical protein
MPQVTNPFSTGSSDPYDESSVMSGGARALVHSMQRSDEVDPMAAEATRLTQQKTQLSQAKDAAKILRNKFLEGEGADLFESDPVTGKPIQNPDKSYVPKMGAEIDSLRSKSGEKVGLLKGAFTSATAGDPTDEAKSAAASLAEREPVYKAKMDKWQRIQDQLTRISQAHDETELQLGQVAQARLQRSGVFGSPDMGQPTPAAAPAQPTDLNSGGTMTRNGKTTTVPGSQFPRQAPYSDMNGDGVRAPATPPFETPLDPNQETQFQNWKAKYAPNDTGSDYDLRGAFKAGLTPGADGHWPDTFKKPNHPTFSDQSVYAKDRPDLAGRWDGDTFVPPTSKAPTYTRTPLADETPVAPTATQPGAATGPSAAQILSVSKQIQDADAVLGGENITPKLKLALQQKRDRLYGMLNKGMSSLNDQLRQRVGEANPGFFQNLMNSLGTAFDNASSELNRFAGTPDEQLLQWTRENLHRDPTPEETAAVLLRRTPGAANPSQVPRSDTFGEKVSSAIGGLAVPAALAVTGQPLMGAAEMGASSAGAERQASAEAGDTPEIQDARAQLGFSINTLAGLIPGGKLGVTRPLAKIAVQGATGAAVGYGSSVLNDVAQQRPVNQGAAVESAILVGLLGSVHGAVDNELQMRDLGQRWSDATGKKFDNNKEAFKDLKKNVEAAVNARTDEQVAAAKAKAAGKDTTAAQPKPGAEQPAAIEAGDSNASSVPAETPANPTAPAPASPEPTNSVPASSAPPIVSADGKTVQQWTFTDADGKQASVTGTGLKDALSKLPKGFEPDLKKSPTQEAIAAPHDHATTQDLKGEAIDNEWTKFSPESQPLGIPRAEMPQIKSENRGALTQFLKARGIEHTEEEVLPGQLKPTQQEYSEAKVQKAREFTGGDRAILVSGDNHVVDGHHQWMAALHDEPNTPIRVIRLNAPIRDVLANVAEFPSVKASAGAKPSSLPENPFSSEWNKKALKDGTYKTPEHEARFKKALAEYNAATGKSLSQSEPQLPGQNSAGAEKPQATVVSAEKPSIVPAPAIKRGSNTPTETLKAVTKASGIKPGGRAHGFLTQFLGKVNQSNPKAFKDMEVHVLNQEQWDAHPELGSKTPTSSGAYDAHTNTLYLNSDKSKGDAIVNTVVHESGHFAEKFALGEKFAQSQWKKIGHEQRVQARKDYDGVDMSNEEQSLLNDRRSRSEWVAMQFARVVRGETEGMSLALKTKLEKYFEDLRALVNKWVGNGKLTTPQLDKKIRDMLGYDDEQAPTPPTESNKPKSKADGLADKLFDGLLGTPAEKEKDQVGLPRERLQMATDLAGAMIDEGITTHEGMAKWLDAKFGKKARKFSQALWNAFGVVNPELSSKPDWSSVYSAADKETSPTDQQPPSNARTELAPAEASQGSSEKQVTKPAPKGKRISVGTPVSGIPDILNEIEDLGGIRSKSSVANAGGEYDDYESTFKGVARLLLRRDSGSAPDQLAQELHSEGKLRDGDARTLMDAINAAVEARTVSRKQAGKEEYQNRFEQAFLGNQHPREYLRSGKAISVDDLNAGDSFTVDGEKFTVKGVDENGNVTIQDGITREVPPGTSVFPDRGVIKKAKVSKEFAPKSETPGELFSSDETPFNLAGTEQPDGERLLQERIDREAAKREQDKQQTQIPGTEVSKNEPSTNGSLERNREGANAGDRAGEENLPNESVATRPNAGEVAGAGAEQQGGAGDDAGSSAVSGEESDSALPQLKPGAIGTEAGATGGEHAGRGVSARGERILDDAGADTAVESVAPERPSGDVVEKQRERSLADRVRDQKRAERKPLVTADLKNIAETLPVLLPEQHDDVFKAERRLQQQGKRGMLFTNGTGTGKTFTGLGIIKRAVRAGAKNVLVVVPQSKKAVDWQHDARHLGLEFNILQDTKSAGDGLTITTYANFRTNDALKNRDFDYVVYDESHKIVQNEEGGNTTALDRHRFVTNHPDYVQSKAEERIVGPRPNATDAKYPGEGFEYPNMPIFEEDNEAWMAKRDAMRAEIDAERKRIEPLTKAVFLSATPFAYHKTLNYGEGYLFDIPKSEGGRGYNQAGGFDQFLVENFGYRMRYNKLTIPESGVDIDLMERMFADRLMKEGAVSGRMIDVPYDYSREFVLVDPGLGTALDKGMSVMYGNTDRDQNHWNYLPRVAGARFTYHYVQQLMEAIKVTQSLDRIRQHLAMGRKIILFHNFVNAIPDHPFRNLEQFADDAETKREIGEFNERYPELAQTDFGKLANPLALLKEEFGKRVTFFNGNVSDKNKLKAIDDFNTDGSGVDIIVAQADSMKEGVSAHDTTGKHQRVVMNVGLPIKPTDAIQEEGRGYRVGVKSNAINEYIVIHTNTEKYAFGSKINQRVRTAENLALGSMARNLQDSFKQGYVNPVAGVPSENQGKGGKEADQRAAVASEFDRARSFYFSRQKKTSKTKSAEGVDYYATPEPLGFKMVEWIKPVANERLLEPSAGHGAIARFFPNFTRNQFVEPSVDLANELRIKVESGATDVGTFEDYNVGNKFDGIVMNPPFGQGGSTAIKHLAKAALQLKDGGRIVALIPEGPAADEKFSKWYEGSDSNLIKVAEFGLPSVTFERAGTSVKTRIVVLDRIDDQNARSEAKIQGRADIQAETAEELFNKIENLEVPPRTEPVAKPENPLKGGRDAVIPVAGGKVGDYSSEEFKHTKTGKPIFVAKPTRHLGDAFTDAKRAAIQKGGRYSSFKGAGAVPGFHFDTAAQRDAFIDSRRDALLGTPPVKGTPDQEEIINKVTGTMEDKRSLRGKVSDYLSTLGDYVQRELQQKLLDRFTAIKRLERATIGTNDLDASISAYKWSRLTQNLPGVMDFLTRHGQIEYKNGSMEMVPGTKGLVDVLRPVVAGGKLRLWEGYVAAYRANRLLAEGKEKNFGKRYDPSTDTWSWDKTRAQDEINELLKLGQQHPEFEAVRKDYVAFQKSVLDVATAAGLIDPAKRAMWERSDYVPFYRIVDALDGKTDTKGPGVRRGFSGQTSGIRELKGGPQKVAILENIFRNTEQLIDASFKNIAMQRIADLAENDNELMVPIPYKAVPFHTTAENVVKQLEAAGVDVSSLTDQELNEIVTFWRMRAPEGKDVVSAMNNGKPVYYRVKDKPLLRSIMAMGPERHSWWMKLLQVPKHRLTQFVTLDPAFIASNTIRDTFHSWVIADTPIKPGWDAMRGFVKSMANDPAKLSIAASGGGTGHYNNLREDQVRKTFMKMTREKREGFLNSIIDTPAKLARFYKSIQGASENANRIAIAESAKKRGASSAEAAFQALDIMDFGLRGDSKALSFFLDTVPFMSARINGLYRIGRGLVNNPKRVATHGAIILGATLALLAANWSNEDYWDLPEWDRDLYYHLWIGGKHIRIPKPFEVGQIFSTVPERLAQFVSKDGDAKLFARRMLSMVGDTFALNPIPQIIKPLVERAINTSFLTGGRIISRGDEYKNPEQQYNAFTSLVARELADAAPDKGPAWLRSPKTLDFLIRGYFGSLGAYTVGAADALIRQAGGYPEKPASKPGDYWLMSRFAPENDTRESKYVSEFYELNQNISEISARIKSLREHGDNAEANQVTLENRSLLQYEGMSKATNKALQSFRKRERDIYEHPGSMSPEARREELVRIAEEKNRLAKMAVQRSPNRPSPIFNPFK